MWFLPLAYSFGKVKASQLGSQLKETGIFSSPGAILTIWFCDTQRPSFSGRAAW